MKVIIRQETSADISDIRKVHDLAFAQFNEGGLVDNLRSSPDFIHELSLVAELNGKIIGHILFSPIKIKGETENFDSLALAPMAVLPSHQCKGVGGLLVKEGLRKAKLLGYSSVIVLGHKDYYPRFGFEPANKWGIYPPFELQDELFMAIELVPGSLGAGVVCYPEAFESV